MPLSLKYMDDRLGPIVDVGFNGIKVDFSSCDPGWFGDDTPIQGNNGETTTVGLYHRSELHRYVDQVIDLLVRGY